MIITAWYFLSLVKKEKNRRGLGNQLLRFSSWASQDNRIYVCSTFIIATSWVALKIIGACCYKMKRFYYSGGNIKKPTDTRSVVYSLSSQCILYFPSTYRMYFPFYSVDQTISLEKKLERERLFFNHYSFQVKWLLVCGVWGSWRKWNCVMYDVSEHHPPPSSFQPKRHNAH